MISKNFYKQSKLVNEFLGGRLQHYPIKEPTTVLTTREYTVQSGDTMYSLARTIFGDDFEYNWTIISDINFLRMPDELQAGEVIKLPIIILDDSHFTKIGYDKTSSLTTKI